MSRRNTRPMNYLAGIHTVLKQIGLSKEDAVALKLRVTGVASAGDMSLEQRRKYFHALLDLQPKPQPRPAGAGAVDDKQWLKARVLWRLLSEAGVVQRNTDAALVEYVARQTHCDAWRFLNQAQVNTVIESLKLWCGRAGVVLRQERGRG